MGLVAPGPGAPGTPWLCVQSTRSATDGSGAILLLGHLVAGPGAGSGAGTAASRAALPRVAPGEEAFAGAVAVWVSGAAVVSLVDPEYVVLPGPTGGWTGGATVLSPLSASGAILCA